MRYTLVGLLLLTGCAYANPRTEVGYSPIWGFKLHNSKDVSIKASKIEADSKNGIWKCDSLEIIDNASKVREANVLQMQAFVEQQRAFNEGFKELLNVIQLLKGPVGAGAAGDQRLPEE